MEKVVPQCGNLVVQIAGNAPWACYKNEADPSSKKVRLEIMADELRATYFLFFLIDLLLQGRVFGRRGETVLDGQIGVVQRPCVDHTR